MRSMETQHSFSFVSPHICTPKKHHEEKCVRNNVSLFARALMRRIASVGNDNFSLFTGHIISWRGLGDRGSGGGKMFLMQRTPLKHNTKMWQMKVSYFYWRRIPQSSFWPFKAPPCSSGKKKMEGPTNLNIYFI